MKTAQLSVHDDGRLYKSKSKKRLRLEPPSLPALLALAVFSLLVLGIFLFVGKYLLLAAALFALFIGLPVYFNLRSGVYEEECDVSCDSMIYDDASSLQSILRRHGEDTYEPTLP